MSESEKTAVLEERTQSHERRLKIIERDGADKDDLKPLDEKVTNLEKNQRWFIIAIMGFMLKAVFDYFNGGAS